MWDDPTGGMSEASRADEESAATLEARASDGETAAFAPGDCEVLVASLDDAVMGRLLIVVDHLRALGEVGEDDLARVLDIGPIELWGTLTNPLKRHVKALGLPLPFEVDARGTQTTWVDTHGIAEPLASALRNEMSRREAASDDDAEDSHGTATPPPERDRYARLLEHLTTADAASDLPMTLEAIETIIGFELPPKAWANPEWWTKEADVPYRHHSRAWRDAGWLALPDLDSAVVTFVRESHAREESPRGIRRLTRAIFGRNGSADDEVSSAEEGPFSAAICAEFAAGLSDRTLDVAHELFSALAADGQIDSPELAARIGIETSGLGGAVSGPLRRRAEAVGCEMPYYIVRGDRRVATMWYPIEGAAPHMADATALERARRRA